MPAPTTSATPQSCRNTTSTTTATKARFLPHHIAHKVAHYYWSGNAEWIDEGAADFLAAISGNARAGAPVAATNQPCPMPGTLPGWKSWATNWDRSTTRAITRWAKGCSLTCTGALAGAGSGKAGATSTGLHWSKIPTTGAKALKQESRISERRFRRPAPSLAAGLRARRPRIAGHQRAHQAGLRPNRPTGAAPKFLPKRRRRRLDIPALEILLPSVGMPLPHHAGNRRILRGRVRNWTPPENNHRRGRLHRWRQWFALDSPRPSPGLPADTGYTSITKVARSPRSNTQPRNHVPGSEDGRARKKPRLQPAPEPGHSIAPACRKASSEAQSPAQDTI